MADIDNSIIPPYIRTGKNKSEIGTFENVAKKKWWKRIFRNDWQTATGKEQRFPHRLGGTPNLVRIFPQVSGGGLPPYEAIEGIHTDTDVVVTVTKGKIYKIDAYLDWIG